MAFEKPDRVPRYDIFLPGYQRTFAMAHGAEAIYDHYRQVDMGCIMADQGGPFLQEAHLISLKGNERIELDTWGRTLLTHTDGFFEKTLQAPLADPSALDRICFDVKPHLRTIQKDAHYHALHARFGVVSGCMGLFMSSYRMRGEEDYLADMVSDPPFVDALIARLEPFLTELGLFTAQKTDTLDTAVWVYDEFCSRLGPLFSPKMFERYFLRPYQRMFARWKANGIRQIILHCDGNSMPLMELLIEAGFTGVQSMAPTAGMYLPDVKKQVGNRMVLIGGMDNIETLAHGTSAQIERQAREVYETALQGGVIL
ncbi:MAG: uroporphyrinogen decarboxylase family protein, partial [Clostridia bacterium]